MSLTFGGIGDNQLGMELAGHSWNSYTRYSVSLLSSNDGTPCRAVGPISNGHAPAVTHDNRVTASDQTSRLLIGDFDGFGRRVHYDAHGVEQGNPASAWIRDVIRASRIVYVEGPKG